MFPNAIPIRLNEEGINKQKEGALQDCITQCNYVILRHYSIIFMNDEHGGILCRHFSSPETRRHTAVCVCMCIWVSMSSYRTISSGFLNYDTIIASHEKSRDSFKILINVRHIPYPPPNTFPFLVRCKRVILSPEETVSGRICFKVLNCFKFLLTVVG